MAVGAAPAAAQAEGGNVARVYFVKPKLEWTLEFEQAYMEHANWHREQGDPWEWHAWQIQTGERYGQYLIGTFGHPWADFDNPPAPGQEDARHFYQNVAPFVESIESQMGVFLPQLSSPAPDGPPKPLTVVRTFQVKQGKADEFLNAVAKLNEAFRKTGWATAYWYTVVSGTAAPAYVVSVPQENWADLAPPELSFEEMLREAHGESEANLILKLLEGAIERHYVEVYAYRADLSYVPGTD